MLIGITSPFVEGLLFVTTCRQAAFTFAALIMGIASWKVVPVGYKDGASDILSQFQRTIFVSLPA